MRKTPSFDAILFDLDGTLIDSLGLFRDAIAHALNLFGKPLDSAYFGEWHAKRLPWSGMLEHHGIAPEHEEEVKNSSNAKFAEFLESTITWLGDSEHVLKTLKERGYPMAIVTTASRKFIGAVSRRIDLRSIIDVIIDAEEVGEKSKPDPYGLLLAAQKLGVSPERCLYVGDQPFDVLAANAAGMTSCLIRSHHTPADAHEKAALAFGAISDILPVIGEKS